MVLRDLHVAFSWALLQLRPPFSTNWPKLVTRLIEIGDIYDEHLIKRRYNIAINSINKILCHNDFVKIAFLSIFLSFHFVEYFDSNFEKSKLKMSP